MRTIKASLQLEDEALELCVMALKSGGILCYPTETFYALGIDPWNDEARSRLIELKGREASKELPLIASDPEMVARFCRVEDPRFQILAGHFWPGPLTIVLEARDRQVSASYAVRVSSHPVAHQLSKAFDRPIVSTSTNRSGENPMTNPQDLPVRLQKGIEILIDGGICKGGSASTIVSLVSQETKILRDGAIPAQQIFSLL